ncbi:hypothetical protein DL767_011489 [Monosporascus sp. MG133]|nr:hypothetical protein DL767_011489 [Monosporascus sp. MG133]
MRPIAFHSAGPFWADLWGHTNGFTPEWPLITGDPEAITFRCSAPLISTSSFTTPRWPRNDIGLGPIGEFAAIRGPRNALELTANMVSQSPVDFRITRIDGWEDGYGESNPEQRTFVLWLT